MNELTRRQIIKGIGLSLCLGIVPRFLSTLLTQTDNAETADKDYILCRGILRKMSYLGETGLNGDLRGRHIKWT